MPGEPNMSTSVAAPSRSAPRAAPAASIRPSFGVLAAIGVGGALGSVVRYELALGAPASVSAGGFPWTTWWINVSGSLVLGLVATMVVERWSPTRYVRPFVGIGVCGGYTTWSTFMTESALLVRDHRAALAVAYLVASVVGGLAALSAGVWLGRTWPLAREPVDMVEYVGDDA